VDFTREPIIETIVTAREGYRLVIRSSKNIGQEEHFVDAVEVVSFGNAFFFRSLERPKPFLVPVVDYEILEVREPRMVLKTPVHEGSVKIGGGRDRDREREREAPREAPQPKSYREETRREPPKEIQREREREREPQIAGETEKEEAYPPREGRHPAPQAGDNRAERRRDRRRGFRRQRRDGSTGGGTNGGMGTRPEKELRTEEEILQRQAGLAMTAALAEEEGYSPQEQAYQGAKEGSQRSSTVADPQNNPPSIVRAVLPPPTTLIRDDLQRLRDSEVYRGAFFIREEGEAGAQQDDEASLESTEADAQFQGKGQAKKESSFEEESFLLSQPSEGEAQPNAPKDI